jgi:hypothetical protein
VMPAPTTNTSTQVPRSDDAIDLPIFVPTG